MPNPYYNLFAKVGFATKQKCCADSTNFGRDKIFHPIPYMPYGGHQWQV
jgi:hypothetical protein